jgi:hypothetical protein
MKFKVERYVVFEAPDAHAASAVMDELELVIEKFVAGRSR